MAVHRAIYPKIAGVRLTSINFIASICAAWEAAHIDRNTICTDLIAMDLFELQLSQASLDWPDTILYSLPDATINCGDSYIVCLSCQASCLSSSHCQSSERTLVDCSMPPMISIVGRVPKHAIPRISVEDELCFFVISRRSLSRLSL